MTLQSLIYMSTAVRPASREEIDHLLSQARSRNESLGVTGLLLYSQGCFLQCIEGSADAVDLVYQYICADPLHDHIFELLRHSIESREFPDWAMAFRATEADPVFSSSADALSRLFPGPNEALSPGRRLLSEFWKGGMGARYQAVIAGKRVRPDGAGLFSRPV